MKKRFGVAFVCAMLAAVSVAAKPPGHQSPSLSEIAAQLEAVGYAPIVEASLKRRGWEVEAYKGDQPVELLVEPASGRVVAEWSDEPERKPPTGSLPLSALLTALGKAGFVHVTEASFEQRDWEVEATRNGSRRELRVDPVTATVLADRLDD